MAITAPAISYLLFEFVTGNLTSIALPFAILNLILYYLFYTWLYALTGRSRLSIPAASCFLYVLSLTETFVVSFRERPAMLWDVMAARTAMTVSSNYTYSVSWKMVTAALVLLAMNILLWRAPKAVKGVKKRLSLLAGTVGATGVFFLVFYLILVPKMDIQVKMWAVKESYSEYGCVLATAASVKDMVITAPEGYDREEIKELAESLKEEPQQESAAIQPVNLICIMNESLADIRKEGEFTTNTEYFPFLDSLKENTIRGNLCMPVFGAMTSNSEFEFLTGDSMALLPAGSIAYQFYVKPNAASLVSTVKAQGYRTVAMHPYPGNNWNRDVCYENMGFDEFLDGDFYEGSEIIRKYVSDRADYEKLVQMVEEKENPEDKLFLFNVTMQNHGGYEGTYDNFNQEVSLTGDDAGKYPKADQYLSLMKKSDEALQYLIEYFEQVEEPTMIVMFGDHLPSLEGEFFDKLAGGSRKYDSPAGYLPWYKTPFIIWTNYEQPAKDVGDMGAVYLSSQVLQAAGLPTTPYDRFMLRMEEELPVVHITGCYDKNGAFYTWKEAEDDTSAVGELIRTYEALVYNHRFDEEKVEEMFLP